MTAECTCRFEDAVLILCEQGRQAYVGRGRETYTAHIVAAVDRIRAGERAAMLAAGVPSQAEIYSRWPSIANLPVPLWTHVYDSLLPYCLPVEQIKAEAREEVWAESAERMKQVRAELLVEYRTASDELKRLAGFVVDELPGEPSQSEGVVDTVIRYVRALLAEQAQGAPSDEEIEAASKEWYWNGPNPSHAIGDCWKAAIAWASARLRPQPPERVDPFEVWWGTAPGFMTDKGLARMAWNAARELKS